MSTATPVPNIVDGECGVTPPSRSASTIIAARTLHVLTIDGYSNTLKSNDPSQHLFLSSPFSAGGHTWCIHYCPIGCTKESKGLHLHLPRSLGHHRRHSVGKGYV
ncbi:Os10g0435100 [Oryza sativa Japonica Group]|uniref:Os10g0435100 protein n=2 Tax=Oryza TaxID=4527 RepID=A0A0P0XV49_ORYSJ|nr:Os10g0435100 [Oryza sativa Japonica Group]